MTRRPFLRLAAVVLIAGAAGLGGCSEGPTQPGPIVQPPPTQEPPPGPPPPPATPPTLGVTRILAFGDSMTEGTTSPALPARRFALDPGLPRSYPFKLQTMLTGRYTAQTISVFNAGKAGRRASEDLSRFNDALSEARPDVVLLLEGANDLNAPLESGEGINDRVRFAVGSLEEMVKSAVARGIPIYLGTLPPQRLGGPKAAAPEFLPRFNDALKVMAGLKGAIIVDVFPQFPLSDIGQDGLHPTDDGYQRLATIWFETLKARHETAPAPAPAPAASAPAANHPDAGQVPGGVGLPAAPQHD